ncbi:ABC transporter substrate-binding protein [Robertmurraya korlensis]|uniref:ABC transporter substrate-binding protein n=1 Tax=Robertmurraya korlensis TaxID=519977 RepID=UPI000AE4BDB0|nr:ABC transporter substrate-binding protein [Robertmurraya korlensis]
MKVPTTLLSILLILAVVLIGCAKETQQPMETIRMASWSKPIVEQSNLYVAKEKGLFEKENLTFEYIPGAGGGDAVKNILAGNADIAFANLEAVLLAAEKGEKLKIIYNIYPENVFNLVSLKESNIESIEDLKGKNVGVYSLASGTYQNLQVLLHHAGIKEEDISITATGVLNFAPLMEGQVAATAATDTGLYDAKQKGLGEVDIIEVKDVLNTPSDVFVVTEKVYNEKKDALIRFLQVYKDSIEYTMENPDEAADIAAKHAVDGSDVTRNKEIIAIRNKTSLNNNGLGTFDFTVLKEVEASYVEMGLLQKPVKIEELATNELVEKLK